MNDSVKTPDDMTLPDGRPVSEMTVAEQAEWDNIRQIVEDGKSLGDGELSQVAGGLTFRETTYDRFRLHTYAFFNGRIDVMMMIQSGAPLANIPWRP